MFEMPPFLKCPVCQQAEGLGILSVSSASLERRCRFCRAQISLPLPELDKKVLYLDQFAVSETFKTRESVRRSDSHSGFWTEATALLDKAIKYQRLICPASNIHRDETMVYRRGNALELAHELMGGDTQFKDTTTIEHAQIYYHLESYLAGEEPSPFDCSVDNILQGKRNAWLPVLHISVETDWSSFSEEVRLAREQAAQDFAPLYERWSRDKPNFKTALETEISSFGPALLDAYRHFVDMAQTADAEGDAKKYLNGALAPVVTLIHELTRIFVKRGAPPEIAIRETVDFLNWPSNRSLPHHVISAHLFAALAHRIAGGQKRRPSRGMLNDIKAISTYAPYVDAMLLDNECASLLDECRWEGRKPFKAQIFSLRHSDQFIGYLRELVDSTPPDVATTARIIYGEQ